MRKALIPLLVISLLTWLAHGAEAQSVAEVFRKVNPSVVVIRARGRDVSASAGGLVRFNEIGSGVIISADGQVMTAAHVVNAMDEITVETLGGPPVRARVLMEHLQLGHVEREVGEAKGGMQQGPAAFD